MWPMVFFCAWTMFVGLVSGGLVWFWCRDYWEPHVAVWRARALTAEGRLERWEELRSLLVGDVAEVVDIQSVRSDAPLRTTPSRSAGLFDQDRGGAA